MFRFISPVVPTKNRKPNQKSKYQRKLHRYLKNQYGIEKGSPVFSKDLRLKVHFYYFCHETHAAKDIHNIVEPFIDDLQGYLFDNDKQLVSFHAHRLDMSHQGEYFEYEIKMNEVDEKLAQELLEVESETKCLIEISEASDNADSVIKITWL
jgi:hypothetical protein